VVDLCGRLASAPLQHLTLAYRERLVHEEDDSVSVISRHSWEVVIELRCRVPETLWGPRECCRSDPDGPVLATDDVLQPIWATEGMLWIDVLVAFDVEERCAESLGLSLAKAPLAKHYLGGDSIHARILAAILPE
jgi:hypothetical protein